MSSTKRMRVGARLMQLLYSFILCYINVKF
jgi:hypothetical protein